MAEQIRKSHAEKAVSAARANKSKNKGKKVTANNRTLKKIPADNGAKKTREVPVRLITSLVFLCLFVLLLVAFFIPEGFFITFLSSFLHGLVGRVGFIVAIPALLYLFIIHAFSGQRPVRMRTYCLIAFVIICGAVTHLALDPQGLPSGFAYVSELYHGGSDGTTGGVLCGDPFDLVGFGLSVCGSLHAGSISTYLCKCAGRPEEYG